VPDHPSHDRFPRLIVAVTMRRSGFAIFDLPTLATVRSMRTVFKADANAQRSTVLATRFYSWLFAQPSLIGTMKNNSRRATEEPLAHDLFVIVVQLAASDQALIALSARLPSQHHPWVVSKLSPRGRGIKTV
jgi:hypothetical protein